ncbi:hypothetical protein STEG23_034656, partial [Scotinomys teguina]
ELAYLPDLLFDPKCLQQFLTHELIGTPKEQDLKSKSCFMTFVCWFFGKLTLFNLSRISDTSMLYDELGTCLSLYHKASYLMTIRCEAESCVRTRDKYSRQGGSQTSWDLTCHLAVKVLDSDLRKHIRGCKLRSLPLDGKHFTHCDIYLFNLTLGILVIKRFGGRTSIQCDNHVGSLERKMHRHLKQRVLDGTKADSSAPTYERGSHSGKTLDF